MRTIVDLPEEQIKALDSSEALHENLRTSRSWDRIHR